MGKKGKGRPLRRAGEPRSVEHVWLVQPPVGGDSIDITPPLGLLLLAAVLRERGLTPHIADLNLAAKQGRLDARRSLRNQFVRALPKRASQVHLIGVSAWSYNFDLAMEFVEAVRRKHPHAPIVVGGPHTTFVDREALEAFPSIDYVLRDEGDRTFPALIEALARGAQPEELATIPGLTWRDPSGAIRRNPSGPVVEDLDALPYPAYDLIDVAAYLACQPTLMIEAGRGCPYNCNFCSTTNMFQRKYRVKSPERLVDEIEWTMQVTGSNRFEFLHDNLVAGKKFVSALCKEIRRRNLDVDWSCTSRTDNLTEALAEEMFLAGCNAIFFGVESMSAERQRWTGKRLDPLRVEEAVAMTRRQHITPALGIIVGFPDETEEEFDATVGAAARWAVPPVAAEISTAMLRYYPGADLFARREELRYDPWAAADAAALPGYRIRPVWRDLCTLFPLQAIHTPPEETRTNLLRRNFVRTFTKVCPQTFLGCLLHLGKGPRALFDALSEGREFRFLEEGRRTELIWNEALAALGATIAASGDPYLRELFTLEVPFWESAPVVEPLDRLEHIIHPKRYVQDQLVAYARGERSEAPETVDGLSILALRAGPEAVVWITPEPERVLRTFEQSYAEDRAATVAFVQELRRGL
ncbi:MAG: radical SAM protein [Planctomycetota bacterium]|nr:MAG: radical SAM protein [Planctomycetota bacterium]